MPIPWSLGTGAIVMTLVAAPGYRLGAICGVQPTRSDLRRSRWGRAVLIAGRRRRSCRSATRGRRNAPDLREWRVNRVRTLESTDEYAAAQSAAAVAIALRRYRIAHGACPDNLASLTPEFLKALPIDPYTGKPTVNSRIGSGLELKAGLSTIPYYDRRPFVWNVPHETLARFIRVQTDSPLARESLAWMKRGRRQATRGWTPEVDATPTPRDAAYGEPVGELAKALQMNRDRMSILSARYERL
jgi:hypothetical protein